MISKKVKMVKATLKLYDLKSKKLIEKEVFIKPVRGKMERALLDYEEQELVKVVEVLDQKEITVTYEMEWCDFIANATVKYE